MNDFIAGLNLPDVLIKVLAAVVILLVTWLVATLIKGAIEKLSSRVSFLQKADASGQELGKTLGTIGSLVVWLIGLITLMDLFGQHTALSPVKEMLDVALSYLPRVVAAGVLLFVGYMVAKIVRTLIQTAMNAAGVDRQVARVLPSKEDSTKPALAVTNLVSSLAFVLIVLVIAIAAVEALGIDSISRPLADMLTLVVTMIPAILVAGVLFAAGAFLGSFLGRVTENTLASTGVDGKAHSLGLLPQNVKASKVAGTLVYALLVVLFAIMAFNVLNLQAVSAVLNEVLHLTGQVVFGAIIIGAGVLVANFVARLVQGAASEILRWGVIVLFAAMGLKFMGLADSIVNLAFGATVVGVAAAAALAFGLGGRDFAKRTLEKVEKKND